MYLKTYEMCKLLEHIEHELKSEFISTYEIEFIV